MTWPVGILCFQVSAITFWGDGVQHQRHPYPAAQRGKGLKSSSLHSVKLHSTTNGAAAKMNFATAPFDYTNRVTVHQMNLKVQGNGLKYYFLIMGSEIE